LIVVMLSIEGCHYAVCHYAVPLAIPEQPTVQHGTFSIMILIINIDCRYAEYRRMSLSSVSLCCAPSYSRTAHSTAWQICHNYTQH
jgi:hypothetical protein